MAAKERRTVENVANEQSNAVLGVILRRKLQRHSRDWRCKRRLGDRWGAMQAGGTEARAGKRGSVEAGCSERFGCRAG